MPPSSKISFSIFSAKEGGAFDVFSEKLSSKRASREDREAVSWSFPKAEGGGGDWAEPELLRARLEGGLLPDARCTRFYSECVHVCRCVYLKSPNNHRFHRQITDYVMSIGNHRVA